MSTPEYGRPTNNMYLVRLLSNGHLDTSFNLKPNGSVWKLLKQQDGKVLVGGSFTHLGDAEQYSLSRLLTNGIVDPDFTVGNLFDNYENVYSVGLQSDDRILVATGYKVLRLHTNGVRDTTWTDTNVFSGGHVSAFLPRADGSILVGGTFQSINGVARSGLALLDSSGQLDPAFDPKLAALSFVFSLIQDDQGNILAGGRMLGLGVTAQRLLARLNSNLTWDEGFSTDEFRDTGNPGEPAIRSVLQQPDGKIVVAGVFYEIGGYWRRHLARLDAQGHVDPCFDPGMGLGGFWGANTLAHQAGGRVLVGGNFLAFTPSVDIRNLVRVLPESECGATRMHVRWYDAQRGGVVAGTCAPGGTNLLQMSTNLIDWWTLTADTMPYVIVYPGDIPPLNVPEAFFRVKKEF